MRNPSCLSRRPCSPISESGRLDWLLVFTTSPRRHFHSTSPRWQISAPKISSLYTDTLPPTASQIASATKFFSLHAPTKTWTAEEWRKSSVHSSTSSTPTTLTPEIAFLGRSNTGKSTLLNALLNSHNPPLCRVGAKPGKTQVMHAWSLLPISHHDPIQAQRHAQSKGQTLAKLTVLDMPGYGHGSHAAWGQQITKYLTRRKQLRRAFVLINPEHGIKANDWATLELLHAHSIPHQIIACKCDQLSRPAVQEALMGIQAQIAAHFSAKTKKKTFALVTLSDVLAIGDLAPKKLGMEPDPLRMMGIEDVRWAMVRAAGLEEYAVSLSEEGRKKKGEKRTTGDIVLEEAQPRTNPQLETKEQGQAQPYTPPPTPTPTSAPAPSIGLSIADFLNDLPLPSSSSPPASKPKPANDSPPPPPPPRATDDASPFGIGTGIDALLSMTQPPKPAAAERRGAMSLRSPSRPSRRVVRAGSGLRASRAVGRR